MPKQRSTPRESVRRWRRPTMWPRSVEACTAPARWRRSIKASITWLGGSSFSALGGTESNPSPVTARQELRSLRIASIDGRWKSGLIIQCSPARWAGHVARKLSCSQPNWLPNEPVCLRCTSGRVFLSQERQVFRAACCCTPKTWSAKSVASASINRVIQAGSDATVRNRSFKKVLRHAQWTKLMGAAANLCGCPSIKGNSWTRLRVRVGCKCPSEDAHANA